jgi:predicted ATPase
MPMPGEASGEGGEVATICVDELTVNDVAGAVPKSTLVAFCKFVPVITTGVPPDEGPCAGLTSVTVGN